MAFSTSGLLTVLGKYVKSINVMNGYFAALETQKDDIYTVLNSAGIQDLYVNLPSQYEGFKDAVSNWIATVIDDVEAILTDEEYVLDELPISATDVTTVLNAIFDHMIANSETIKSSVVSIGGADTDQNKFTILRSDAASMLLDPYGFVTRTLDGVNAPSSLVSAHPSYNNVEGQLAKTCTLYMKCTSSSAGAEVMQVFGDSPFEPSYTGDNENPGVGPSITNVESLNLITSNYQFDDWSGDNPTDWTLTGGAAGTDWEDESGTGAGPLKINTVGTYVKRQITGLSRRTMYFFGAVIGGGLTSGTNTVKFRVETVDGATVHKNFPTLTFSGGAFGFDYVYGFYSPDDSVNLNDIYLTIEHDAEGNAANYTQVWKVVIAPVTYFNGLGLAMWNPWLEDGSLLSTQGDEGVQILPTNSYGSTAISNNNGGVFQTFFRKAFNIQLPTADSPTISDTLAT
jgi:hypothetical protein